MENDIILKKLERIEKYIVGLKAILNVQELSDYTGFKKSHIYKLVHKNIIPYSKPNGKMLFFEREKIDFWLLNSSFKSDAGLKKEAMEYTLGKRRNY